MTFVLNNFENGDQKSSFSYANPNIIAVLLKKRWKKTTQNKKKEKKTKENKRKQPGQITEYLKDDFQRALVESQTVIS